MSAAPRHALTLGYAPGVAKKKTNPVAEVAESAAEKKEKAPPRAGKPSALLDTRAIYRGHCLEQLKNLPDTCVEGRA